MKTTVTLLFLAAACLLPVSAQDKPKDPFVKEKKAAEEAQNAPPETPKNVHCLLETMTLPQADYLALLDAPADRGKLYERVQEAVKAGTAKLDGCHLLINKSGVRASAEAVDALMFPLKWDNADATGFQYPSEWETRVLGDRLEYDCVVEPEGKLLSVTHAFTRDRFLGYQLYKADSTVPGIPVAAFFERQSPASRGVVPGLPALLSTLSNPQPGGGITLVFGTFTVTPLHAPGQSAAKGTGSLRLDARVISLDRVKGNELLKQHRQDDAGCLASLKSLISTQDAVLEHVSSLSTLPGNRVVHLSGGVIHVGVELSPAFPAMAGDKPTPAQTASATAVQPRELDFRWEVECVLNKERTLCDSTLSFTHAGPSGNVKDKNWTEHNPEIPVFANQRIMTSFTQPLGSTVLVGTLNPPGDTGVNERKDEGRMWLLFLDANQE